MQGVDHGYGGSHGEHSGLEIKAFMGGVSEFVVIQIPAKAIGDCVAYNDFDRDLFSSLFLEVSMLKKAPDRNCSLVQPIVWDFNRKEHDARKPSGTTKSETPNLYDEYRRRMTPILETYGGGFRYDFRGIQCP